MKNKKDQIIEKSIEILSKYGYSDFSIGVVAKELNISKGVVSYHFPQKELLLKNIVNDFYKDAAEYMEKHISIEESAINVLNLYIKSNLYFVVENKKNTLAVMQIVTNSRDKDGELIFKDNDNSIYQPLIEIFKYGQEVDKTFREFDVIVMSSLIRSAIDCISARIANNEIEDIDKAIQEVVTTFELATRRELR